MSERLTGQWRHRAMKKRFCGVKLVLQVEVVRTISDTEPTSCHTSTWKVTDWRDARVEDLREIKFGASE